MTTVAAAPYLPVVATAQPAQDALVVSLHDVAPSTQKVSEEILLRLTKLGVRVCSLLVVPHYHRKEAVTENPRFVSWLRNLEADGHEIVIHGYFHDRPKQRGDTLADRIVTNVYTRAEGEFFDLGYDEALRRITSAYQTFRAAGLTPTGFIAPAWLLSPPAEQAAHDAGMEYTTRLRSVVDLRSGDIFRARSLVYSVANQWRRIVSLVWNWGVFQVMKQQPLTRLSIHPRDYSYPAIWDQIERFISEMVPLKVPMTYRDWIQEQRRGG